MENEFDEVMSQRTDEELIAILNGPEDDYQPPAMDAARRVFDKRRISQERVTVFRNEVKQKRLEDEVKANEPLETRYKLIAFFFPKVYRWFATDIFDEAYTRKWDELNRWHWYGVAFYVGIILLIVLMESL